MPRYIKGVITLSGLNSDEELNSLALLTEERELIIVYTEKSFLNRQKLLDLISNLGESSYWVIDKFIREHNDSDLIYTGLILALEACNYHDTVEWIELKHKRSDRIKYEALRFYRDHINQFELKLMNFEKGLDALTDILDWIYQYQLTINNTESKSTNRSSNQKSKLDEYIDIIVEELNSLESLDWITKVVTDREYDKFSHILERVVEPERFNDSIHDLLKDDEVKAFINDIASGKMKYIDLCSRYSVTNSNAIAIATWLDSEGY